MKIAVIGAGVAGLTAGRVLAEAGHEVVVFEKSKGYGGRLATRYAGAKGDTKLDYGLPYIEAGSPKIESFINHLQSKGILEPFVGPFVHKDAEGKTKQVKPTRKRYIAPDGLNKAGKELARMVDVRLETKVSGITHIGEDRTRKRSWMLNFPTGYTENADAVIIATSSKQAYAILNTTIDEVATLKLLRDVDSVEYEPSFSFMAGYGNAEIPEWAVMECENEIISSITNEAVKRGKDAECSFVVHTTSGFAQKHMNSDQERIEEIILDELSEVIGGWSALPDWKQLHFWRYSKVINPLPCPFMEVVGNDAPIALIGSYMNGNSLESAYLSGLAIGTYWNDKFSD